MNDGAHVVCLRWRLGDDDLERAWTDAVDQRRRKHRDFAIDRDANAAVRHINGDRLRLEPQKRRGISLQGAMSLLARK